MSQEEATVDDAVTKAKKKLLEDKVRALDIEISKINHIQRCLDLTMKYSKSTTTETNGVETTTTELVKRTDPQTNQPITDEKCLEMNTFWLGQADIALA